FHSGKPVFVIRNGEGELVVMSQALYEEKLSAQVELYQKLAIAEAYRAAGHKGRTHAEVMESFRKTAL
ncbi:MAG TPA: prevent-host-death protein, partial [Deltaproteobacteria bacterium]|nr:prevent-host-death protein [Deltaproteobacteria bacterium]